MVLTFEVLSWFIGLRPGSILFDHLDHSKENVPVALTVRIDVEGPISTRPGGRILRSQYKRVSVIV